MFFNLFYFIVLAALGFCAITPICMYLKKNIISEYKLKNDVWIYMWILSFIFTTALYFLLPNFNDLISEIKYIRIFLAFILSAFIYAAHLLEMRKTEFFVICLSSAVATFLIPNNILVFEGNIPFIADRLIIFAGIFLITFFAKILNGMSAVFALFMLTCLLGISLISLLEGLPLAFGFIAFALTGIWLGFLRYNWYPSELFLTDGACTSAGFLLANFFVYSCQEFAGSSMLILCAYLISEIIWVVTRRYIFRIKEPDFYNNTSYFCAYLKDITVPAILVAIYKIGIINIIFAGFQIYSPNMFSLPVFSVVVNMWLLNTMCNASESKLSLKDVNKAFIQDIKDEVSNIKQSLEKDKK